MTSREAPSCLRCAGLEKELQRRQIQDRKTADALEEAEKAREVYRRLAYRLCLKLDAAEDRIAELTPREDSTLHEDPAS